MLTDNSWRSGLEKFRDYIETSDNLVVVLTDPNGCLLDCNDGFLNMSGLLEKPVGRHLAEFFAGEDIEDLRQIVEDRGGKFEINLRPADSKEMMLIGAAFVVEENLLIVCERIAVNNDELVAKISGLNEKFVNTARDLAREKIQLQKAMKEIKTLRGLLPICAWCKRVRDEEELWHEVETYISRHSDADFSHGICPDCYETRVKPQIDEMRERKKRGEDNPETAEGTNNG